jgi:hypothetical protein
VFLFVLALGLTFVVRRIAAATILLACLLCLPLFLYFSVPGFIHWIFSGEYKVLLQASFVWDWWSIGGIVVLTLAAFACLPSFVNTSARTCLGR